MRFREFYQAYMEVAKSGFDLLSDYRNEYIVLCISAILAVIIFEFALLYIEGKVNKYLAQKHLRRLKRGA